jgi:hypothetical protein
MSSINVLFQDFTSRWFPAHLTETYGYSKDSGSHGLFALICHWREMVTRYSRSRTDAYPHERR